MTPDANDLCVFAIRRGDVENKELYCNPLYPYYLALIERYKKSPFANGVMKDHIMVNPKTEVSRLSDDSFVSFVPMSNVQEKNNTVTFDQVPYSAVKKGFTVFQRNDMLWAKITPCMQNGKSCIVDKMPTEIGFGSTEFHVIRKRSNNVYMPFLWAIFSNENVLRAAQATFSGTAGQQRVSASFLEEFPAVLPDYHTQKKLVEILEEKLQERNQKLEEANRLLENMDCFIHSTLAIKDISFNSSIICAVRVSDLYENGTFSAEYYHSERMAAINAIKASGPVKKLSEIVTFHREIVDSSKSSDAYLGLAGVESQTGELSGVVEDSAGQAFAYDKNDVLYGRLRPYLNKVMFAEQSGICSTEFHVMRVKNKNEVLPEYIAAILRSDLTLSQTKHMMTGNTHPRISNDDVKNLFIPVPDITKQKEIVEELHRCRQKARRLRVEAEQAWRAAKQQFERELLGE